MARPGIMVYFDMMGPLGKLPDADKGRLFWAMLEYGKNGTVPEFEGLALALAWEFVKPKIDKDSEEYNRTILKRQYATFCRDRKKKGEPDISFEEWLTAFDMENHHMISHDIKWYPTTSTTTTTSTSTTTTTSTATEATANAGGEACAAAEKEGKIVGGVVRLTDAQVQDLRLRLGQDKFDYYVDKLSDFIIRNDAKVKNHYETILKWWQEDGAVRRQGKQKQGIPKGASGTLGQAELDAIQRLLNED